MGRTKIQYPTPTHEEWRKSARAVWGSMSTEQRAQALKRAGIKSRNSANRIMSDAAEDAGSTYDAIEKLRAGMNAVATKASLPALPPALVPVRSWEHHAWCMAGLEAKDHPELAAWVDLGRRLQNAGRLTEAISDVKRLFFPDLSALDDSMADLPLNLNASELIRIGHESSDESPSDPPAKPKHGSAKRGQRGRRVARVDPPR